MSQQTIQHLFVGGEWVESAASGATFGVTNPATGETLATLPDVGEGGSYGIEEFLDVKYVSLGGIQDVS